MTESREIKTIETTGGHKVEIKTYVTGGEAREISNVYIADTNVEMDETGKVKMPTINAGLVNRAQDKAIEMIVVSVDGSTENVVQTVLALPKWDFDEILKAVDEAQKGLSEKKS